MLGGADNANGDLPSYITGANTSKRQFIPESQQGAGLTRFADISNALAVQLAFPDTFFRYPGQLLIAE